MVVSFDWRGEVRPRWLMVLPPPHHRDRIQSVPTLKEMCRLRLRRDIGAGQLLPHTMQLPFKRWPGLLSFWFYGVKMTVARRP